MARTRKIFTCALQDHETTGALRYIELNNDGLPIKSDKEGALIGEFYLRKAALNGAIPNRVTVSIEY
jgi:hypothetical protein